MKREEAVTLVAMLKAAIGGFVERDQLAYFEAELERLDAELATRAVDRGRSLWKRFPSWAEFRELYVAERKLSQPDAQPARRPAGPRTMPAWIKRWVAARFLYRRFDRPRDMRPFPEQTGHVDPSEPHMPPEEWAAEGEEVSDAEAWRAVRGGS